MRLNYSTLEHLRTRFQALEMERAGRAYLVSYRKLNHLSSLVGALAWVLIPKWHVPSLISWKICMISQSQCWACLTFEPLVGAKAFAHVLHDLPLRMENPRFTHTFTDEDGMMLLKKWAKKSDGKEREKVISRLSRMKLKTLKWRLRETQNKRGWVKKMLVDLDQVKLGICWLNFES